MKNPMLDGTFLAHFNTELCDTNLCLWIKEYIVDRFNVVDLPGMVNPMTNMNGFTISIRDKLSGVPYRLSQYSPEELAFGLCLQLTRSPLMLLQDFGHHVGHL